jgi:hypothetical protein
MEGNFLYVKKVPNQVDYSGKVTKICDASLAKLLPPTIQFFNISIPPFDSAIACPKPNAMQNI